MEEAGECGEQELNHSDEQAEKFYQDLKQRGICVRVGMEATGYSRWFERLLAELGFELWVGDPAEIQAKRIEKQKTDRNDARLLLRVMRENNFPQIWVPSPENWDLRQLLWHRHRLVQMRTRIMNQMHQSSARKQRLGHISKQGSSLIQEQCGNAVPQAKLIRDRRGDRCEIQQVFEVEKRSRSGGAAKFIRNGG